ncbi:MAG: alanine racemase [Chloroflexota bacterium]|nr:alanine racemase [Chloroflexota bacterium]
MERPVSKPIGQHFLELDTPALIVNNSRLRTNIENTAEDLMKIGIKLIPNTATHGTSGIARTQTGYNPKSPIFVDTFQQAECFFQAGFENIIIQAPPVSSRKIDSLRHLQDSQTLILSISNVSHLDVLKKTHGRRISVLLKIPNKSDSVGFKTHEELIKLIENMETLEHLRFEGLITNANEMESIEQACEVLISAAKYLDSNSISSDQRLLNASNLILEKEFNDIPKGITGLISGTYPFYTATQNTVCSVISTVMSTPEPGKAFVDCGQKAISIDQGVPSVINYPDAEIEKMSAEHGYVIFDSSKLNLQIGDKILLAPASYSGTFNLYDFVNIIEEDKLQSIIPTDSRGAFK